MNDILWHNSRSSALSLYPQIVPVPANRINMKHKFFDLINVGEGGA